MLQQLAVSALAPCDGHDPALVVNEQVELEAQEPAHGGTAPLGQPSEHPAATDTGVVTDRQLGVIDTVDASGLATVPMEQEEQCSRRGGIKATNLL